MQMFEIAKGDRLPSLEFQLFNGSSPVDLSAASAVVFTMRHQRTGHVVTGPLTMVNSVTGRVRYDWAAGDTDVAGAYTPRAVATFGGLLMTFPTCPENGDFVVEVCG
jgi:hypothetical protein